MRKTKYTVKPTTQFKKDYKLAMKRGLKIRDTQRPVRQIAYLILQTAKGVT